ncbi:hypothetical protein Ciccas_004489 [Cichlidogyrus casuarinus]|uniref:RNase III domain-containing protein n=1 Tax=Cichlidogyrus casuarinus TaxID=1844966 RepID=A0ABD2QBD8_9PLAT
MPPPENLMGDVLIKTIQEFPINNETFDLIILNRLIEGIDYALFQPIIILEYPFLPSKGPALDSTNFIRISTRNDLELENLASFSSILTVHTNVNNTVFLKADQSNNSRVDVGDPLKFLEKYLNLLEEKFGKKFACAFEPSKDEDTHVYGATYPTGLRSRSKARGPKAATKKLALLYCRQAICNKLIAEAVVDYDAKSHTMKLTQTAPDSSRMSRSVSRSPSSFDLEPEEILVEQDDEVYELNTGQVEKIEPELTIGLGQPRDYYPIKPARTLSSPYQQTILANSSFYLYTFRFPVPDLLAKLYSLPENSLTYTDKSIAVLFSEPISMNKLVCRLPLYLQGGMHRICFKLVQQFSGLSSVHYSLVRMGHKILSFLSIPHKMGRTPFGHSPKLFSTTNPLSEFDSKFEFDPEKARINSFLTIFCETKKDIDFEALSGLVSWCKSTKNNFGMGKQSAFISSGILHNFGMNLNDLPPEERTGRIVRPVEFRPEDPGCHVSLWRGSNKVHCVRVSRNMGATYVVSGHTLKAIKSQSRPQWFPYANTVEVHPLPAWLWIQLTLTPSVLFQLERCMHASDLHVRLLKELYEDDVDLDSSCVPDGTVLMVDRLLGKPTRETSPDPLEVQVCDLPHIGYTDTDFNINESLKLFDPIYETNPIPAYSPEANNENEPLIPRPELLMVSTTHINARDMINYERLEWFGDSLIKFATSCVLFATMKDAEGEMSEKRSTIVSNANLCQIMKQLDLVQYIIGYAFTVENHYIPPSFLVSSPTPHDQSISQILMDKVVADCLESLIGCFLYYCGPQPTIRLLSWFGLTQYPVPKLVASDDAFASIIRQQSYMKLQSEMQPGLAWPKFFLAKDLSLYPGKIEELQAMPNSELVARIESIFGYRFQFKALVMQATTHTSSLENTWGNYRRFEFLGNAVIEFVLTERIYREQNRLSPGELTSVRSALLTCPNLALIVLKMGIHDCLQCDKNLNLQIDQIILLEEKVAPKGINYKMYADLLESIIGAIFLDCDGDHETISCIINNIFEDTYARVIKSQFL